MQKHLILKAKILELDEAVVAAKRNGDFESAQMYSSELIPLILRLIHVVGTTDSDLGSDR